MRRTVWMLIVAALVTAGCSSPEESRERTELVLKRQPIVVIDGQPVAVDLDGDGRETVTLDASGSTDVDGAVVNYRWSMGLEDLGRQPTYTGEFEVGEQVITITITDDDDLKDVQTVVVRVLEPYTSTETSPVIDLWSGFSMHTGDGVGERWFNIAGNVADPDGISMLTWSFNGVFVDSLNLGPDNRRLVRAGDFLIDIPRDWLEVGTNTVEVVATDNRAEITTALISITGEDDSPPAFPVTIDWNTQPVDGLVEVVDGGWFVDGGELVLAEEYQGYDRLLAIGDVGWTEFDVRTWVVLDAIADSVGPFSNTPGLGLLLRWNGHNDSVAPGSQPEAGFRPDGGLTPTPYGAFPFYTFDPIDNSGLFEMQNHRSTVISSDDSLQIRRGVKYELRADAQVVVGGTVYRAKLWQSGLPEPDEWAVAYVAGTGDFEARSGSVVLVAHEVAARFGPVTISSMADADRLTVTEVNALRATLG